MSLFVYVLTRIHVFFDAFTRFAYARFLRIFWFAYLRAALYLYFFLVGLLKTAYLSHWVLISWDILTLRVL